MSQKKKMNVLFWLRKSRAQNGANAPLYCRITINGQRYDFPLNVSIRSTSWNASIQKSIGKTEQDREANRAIDNARIAIEEVTAKITEKNYELNTANFRLIHTAPTCQYNTIKLLFEYHNNIEGDTLRESTYKGYRVTLRHLLNFIRIKYHVADYNITSIDKTFTMEFYAYLKGYRKEGKIKCRTNAALKHIQRFHKVMNLAERNEWINRNPVILEGIHQTKVNKGFLSEEELQVITHTMLPSHLAVTRDIFLFAVYTGMCYCDIQELTNDNITRGIDGNQWLQYYQKKTNQRVSLPLLQPAARILMQYATHKDTHQHLPIFQVPCNQVINRSLKQIATIAKVNKKITFHMARHTFATTITLCNRIPIETVSKMLGHAKLSTTQIYAEVIDTKIMDDMAALKELFSNKYSDNIDKKASNQ